MSITITEEAAKQIKEIMNQNGKPESKLRLWVAGMTCSGLRYGMGLDEEPTEEGDQTFESAGIQVIMDTNSIEYMGGSKIDYITNENGGSFQIDNPKAPAGGCSCSSDGEEGGCSSCGSE